MMQQNSSTNSRRPSGVIGKSNRRAVMTCLLCRILGRIVVQHRHLACDAPLSERSPSRRRSLSSLKVAVEQFGSNQKNHNEV
jgi:hypothetical protein